MQVCKNYANFKHSIGQKFNVKIIKATHRRRCFSKTFVSEKIYYKIPKIFGLKNVTSIFVTNLVNVGKEVGEYLSYNTYICIYLQNKKISFIVINFW